MTEITFTRLLTIFLAQQDISFQMAVLTLKVPITMSINNLLVISMLSQSERS